ncbi:hypothetical protein E4U59_007059, partial [Claviceps monticola]
MDQRIVACRAPRAKIRSRPPAEISLSLPVVEKSELIKHQASGSAVGIREPTTGLFVPSWDVAIEPGQEDKIVVNGTVQQVDAYMESNYPGWSAKWANFTSKSAPAKRVTAARPTRPDMMNVKSIMCDHPLPGCFTRAIFGGINYLRKIKKTIIWCNDTDQPKVLDSFSDIALGAEVVVYTCSADGYDIEVSGQAFLFGDYSVI